jgi:flagellar protein FlgJ
MSAPKVNFYADFQGLAALRRDAKAEAPDALKQAAKQFESLFTRELLKSMRAASMGNDLFDSEQTKFYQDMFDDQLAVHLSEGKGLGLADMLVRQLQQGGAMPSGSQSAARAEPVEALPLGPKNPSTPLRANGSEVPSTRSAEAGKPASKKEAFISSMLPHAERAARALGVDPHALVAQAALETGWGKSMPRAADGSPSYNLFGIKATPMWNGASVAGQTLEFEAGVSVKRQERFRAYDNVAQSFADYAALLGRSSRYAAARNTGGDTHAFAKALQDGGYATDPDYARKLSALTAEVRAIAAAKEPASLKLAAQAPIAQGEGVRG